MELNKIKIKELYNHITIKSGILLLIIILSFIALFSETKLTIIAATKLSTVGIILTLIINQIILFYSLSNHNHNQYKIYMILLSILISLMLFYTLYIKRIYDEEYKIINQLKEKDIIEDTNVSC
jgi:cobalamin biosynthesis protein CobD/CbiB